MDKERILRLCNQIEMIIVTICNTGYTIQPGDEEAIFNRTKAIMDEVSAPPKSNADRIRQMTDEELAKKLRCDSCLYQVMKSECELSECVDGILAWLRKEVSEDATY